MYSFRADLAPALGYPALTGLVLRNPRHDTVLREHDALVNNVLAVFGRR